MSDLKQHSVDVKTPAGKAAGTVDLDADVFGLEPNVPLMHQVVTAQLAARRSGTQSTKTRAEVRGGGAKPYRQKGTGNARQGSIRAPHYTGGGVALGPKPRKYDQKTPKKMVKQAMRSALSDRAAEGKVLVVDSWGMDAPKTKLAKEALNTLGVDGNVLVVLERHDLVAQRSFRNLPNVQVIDVGELNAYDILCSDWVVFTQASLPTNGADATTAATPAAEKRAAKKPVAEKPVAETPVAEKAGDEQSSTEDGPYGPGSHAPLDDPQEQPDGFPVKGNADSMLFHNTDSPFYGRTVAEVWFADDASAEAAGFSKPDSQKD